MPQGTWVGSAPTTPTQTGDYVIARSASTPEWRLVGVTTAQALAFEQFLSTMQSHPFISASEALGEFSQAGRVYEVQFTHAGAGYGAQATFAMTYSRSQGIFVDGRRFISVITGNPVHGILQFNLDSIAVGGPINQTRMNDYGSHELDHFKYGGHFYTLRDLWPHPRAPTASELRSMDGTLVSQVLQGWLADTPVQLYDANGNLLPGQAIRRSAGGTESQYVDAFYIDYAARLGSAWQSMNGSRGGYAQYAHERNIPVVNVPAEAYGIRPGDTLRVVDADGVELVLVGTNETPFPIADLARMFGSILGRQLAGDDLVLGTLAGSILGTIAYNLGQQISAFNGNVVWVNTGDGVVAAVGETAGKVWNDFGNELRNFTANAAIGSVSSYLALELGESLGLEGFGAELFSAGVGTVLQHTLTNLVANVPGLSFINPDAVGHAFSFDGLGGALANSFATPANNVNSADEAVDKGVPTDFASRNWRYEVSRATRGGALPATQIVGGDMLAKRAANDNCVFSFARAL